MVTPDMVSIPAVINTDDKSTNAPACSTSSDIAAWLEARELEVWSSFPDPFAPPPTPAVTLPATSSAAAEDPVNLLGIYTESTATISGVKFPIGWRFERWELQAFVAQILAGERIGRRGESGKSPRVCTCLRHVMPLRHGVEFFYSEKWKRATAGGLVICASPWLCPVCAAKISEGRRVQLGDGLAVVRARGWYACMATYTVRHKAHHTLDYLLPALLSALESMKGNRGYRELVARYGFVGSIKALEVLYGDENGWHAHAHEILIFERRVNVHAFQRALLALWQSAAAVQGLTMTERGVDVRHTKGAVEDYIAKFGREPARQPFGVEGEMTKGHLKRGRKSQLLSPFALVQYYRDTGDLAAVDRFKEYAHAFYGRRQLFWSPGLKDTLGVTDKSDEELASERDEGAVLLGGLPVPIWTALLRAGLRSQVFAAADTGDWTQVEALVLQVLAEEDVA